MTGLSKTLNDVSDNCGEVIFHKNSPWGFPHIYVVLFVFVIVATEDIKFLTGEIHNKQQSHVSEVYTTIPLRIKDSYLSCLLEFGVFF